MKKVFICSLFLVFFLTSEVAVAISSPAQVLNKQLQRFKTYVANFKQITLSDQGQVVQRGSGQIWIKRPGKFRWETNQPTHQILITNGKTLWIYDVDLAQATKQALSKRTVIDPASLLSGSTKNLTKTFNVSLKAEGDLKRFILIPLKEQLGFEKIELLFDKANLTSMKVMNKLDQTTDFTFSKIKLNSSLSDSLFEFKKTPNVDVISE